MDDIVNRASGSDTPEAPGAPERKPQPRRVSRITGDLSAIGEPALWGLGGALALGIILISAWIYRYLSPDAHRVHLILCLAAFTFALGLPFLWRVSLPRWDSV